MRPGRRFPGGRSSLHLEGSMGKLPRDKADKARSILRRLAAQERERVALEEFIRGRTYAAIGERLDVTEGAAYKIVHRALIRRAEEEGPTVEAARVVYTGRLEYLMSRWMPYADGTARTDPDDPEHRPGPPDSRLGELLLKALEKWAGVMGVRAAVPAGVFGEAGTPEDASVKINIVLAQLTAAREKNVVIEGSLASVNARLDGRGEDADDDRPPPPPMGITAHETPYEMPYLERR